MQLLHIIFRAAAVTACLLQACRSHFPHEVLQPLPAWAGCLQAAQGTVSAVMQAPRMKGLCLQPQRTRVARQ